MTGAVPPAATSSAVTNPPAITQHPPASTLTTAAITTCSNPFFFFTAFSGLGVVQGCFFFPPSFGCDGNCRLGSSQSPAPPFDSKISFNQKMRWLDVQKHFSFFFFSPLRTAILAVANKHAALSPRHDCLRQPGRTLPANPRCLRTASPVPPPPSIPAPGQRGVLAPGERRKLGLSSICGASSGVVGRCGAGTEPITAVPPPVSSRFISSPLGCWPGEGAGGGNKKKKLFHPQKWSCTELKAVRLKSWQRRGEGGPVPRRAGFWGASLSSQPASRVAVGTVRGQGASALAPSLPSH